MFGGVFWGVVGGRLCSARGGDFEGSRAGGLWGEGCGSERGGVGAEAWAGCWQAAILPGPVSRSAKRAALFCAAAKKKPAPHLEGGEVFQQPARALVPIRSLLPGQPPTCSRCGPLLTRSTRNGMAEPPSMACGRARAAGANVLG